MKIDDRQVDDWKGRKRETAEGRECKRRHMISCFLCLPCASYSDGNIEWRQGMHPGKCQWVNTSEAKVLRSVYRDDHHGNTTQRSFVVPLYNRIQRLHYKCFEVWDAATSLQKVAYGRDEGKTELLCTQILFKCVGDHTAKRFGYQKIVELYPGTESVQQCTELSLILRNEDIWNKQLNISNAIIQKDVWISGVFSQKGVLSMISTVGNWESIYE